jgi:hypothetical protein
MQLQSSGIRWLIQHKNKTKLSGSGLGSQQSLCHVPLVRLEEFRHRLVLLCVTFDTVKPFEGLDQRVDH